ncbi:hypothetical protein COLO4_32721 [Corchorus olitorius]|uniref:Uncharacterized protein n=1 Tax=Corchorus olitorius TaxID=93759 RepID=A0A1R3GYP0_9ROSI|nr:hypothetical protein COLO4_32721 [Corchorus olitorius]
MDIQPFEMRLKESPAHVMSIEEEPDGNPLYHDILQYVKHQKYPECAAENDKRVIRRMSMV